MREILRFDDGIESANPPVTDDEVLTRLADLETENTNQQNDINQNNAHRIDTAIHLQIDDSSSVNNRVLSSLEIDSRIAALVDSSPAALDTLNELAAALGNDPNFATTINNLISGNTSEINTLKETVGANEVYFGDKNTDGTYRIRSNAGVLLIEKRITGAYQEIQGFME